MEFQEHGFDARDFGLIQDLDICDIVAPVDVKDGAETTLMETLKETNVAPVRDPGL